MKFDVASSSPIVGSNTSAVRLIQLGQVRDIEKAIIGLSKNQG